MPAQDKAVGCMQDHQQCYGCLKPQVIHLDSIKGEFSFVCCQTCDLVWIEPMPSADELTEFYDGYHKTAQYTRKLRSKIRRAKNRIFWTNFWRKSGTFLDVGCNVGFAVEAARRLGFDATGIDVDSQTITMAQPQFPKARFEAIGVADMAAARRTFDFVYCSEVIEHLSARDLDDFLQALRQVMAPNALLLLTTPDIRHRSLPNDFASLVQHDMFRPPEHIFYFSKTSLEVLMRRNGFTGLKFQYSAQPTIKLVAKSHA